MKFIVNGVEKNVSLKVWDNKSNQLAYGGEDIFSGVETGVHTDPRFTWDEDGEGWACTEESYDELIEFWKEETAKYNLREPNWFTEGLDADELQDEIWLDLEYLFDYD